ncbi:alpha/beta hydrolase [Novipirellula artificiosorum]|uniref:Alpha/beta hydrolase family protein n=1 Tax=Novipirellula artificiosorum TaxID=2528016 RepID=A0A5C6DTP1_9BACT|nr:alpha/beta hydrolase [Novipirellula artificiosorum]TWU40703.1 Alpha/beta hydrolase family protein [Novipirellula artificiosorum]
MRIKAAADVQTSPSMRLLSGRFLMTSRDFVNEWSPVSFGFVNPRPLVVVFYVCLISIAMASLAVGQDRGAKKKEGPLPVEPMTLKTRDGISLRAAYFPSKKQKDAIPVLLIHEWQGQGSPYLKLVLALQEAGCAVLVPEYRGHGGSKDYVDIRGNIQQFNPATMGKRDVERIIAFDLEEAKQFLKEKNNKGELNLNALVLVGIREGGIFASLFTVRDWRWPSVGRKKQGQDVKALVLISPEKQMKGLSIDSTLTDPNLIRLPILVVAGDTSPDAAEANRVSKRIEGYKKRMGQGKAIGFKQEMLKTSLSGPALVNEAEKLIPTVVSFVTENVSADGEQNPWVNRQ